MILRFPSAGDRPIILMCVQDLLSGKKFLCEMLLDTGADSTCFPAAHATAFGHNNHHPHVKKDKAGGVGGESVVYLHSVQTALIDPQKASPGVFPVVWQSKLKRALFVETLNMKTGLLGRDVMAEWKKISFVPTPTRPHSRWDMVIEI